jgi:periplasmic protein TonB
MSSKNTFFRRSSVVANQDNSRFILLLLVMLVAMLHLLLYRWLMLPPVQMQNQAEEALARPFKLEVSMINAPGKPKESVEAVAAKAPPEKKAPTQVSKPSASTSNKPIDWAGLQQKAESTENQKNRTVKIQRSLNSAQAVSSSVIHDPAVSPHAVDNFPVSDLHNPSPVYPEMAAFLGYQGTSFIRVSVSAQGVSQKVEVLRSSGHGELDQAAVAALRKWRFTPANLDNHPVADSVVIVVRFILE